MTGVNNGSDDYTANIDDGNGDSSDNNTDDDNYK